MTDENEIEAQPLQGRLAVPLQFSLGQQDIDVEQLLSLQSGYVFRLGAISESPVELTLRGRSVARGELVDVDGHIGIRVTEVSSND